MSQENLKVAFLGDSITYGYGLSNRNDGYVNLLKEKYHLKAVFNEGVNGSKISKSKTINKDEPWSDQDFNTRVNNIDSDIDMVVIFGGTNDFGGHRKIGKLESDDAYCFYGGYNALIKNIKNRCPNAEIVLITPLRRTYQNFFNFVGHTLKDYVKAVINIAHKYDLKLIDAFNDFEFDPNDKSISFDGLHLTKKGYTLLADFLGPRLFEE